MSLENSQTNAATPLDDVGNVFMEITSRCNMDCKFCPYHVLKREKQDMPRELVLKVINELRGGKNNLTFHVLGEPLLNRNFFEYAGLCDKYGIKYWLVCNGLLLTPQINDKLFSLKNLTNLEISFHTFTDRAFGLRGCAMPFDKYLDKIKSAIFSSKRYENDIQINMDIMYDLDMAAGAWSNFNMDDWSEFSRVLLAWKKELEEKFPGAAQKHEKFYNGRKKIFQRGDSYHYRQFEDIPKNLFRDLPPHINWIRWEIFPNVFVTIKKFFFFTKNAPYLQNALDRKTEVIPANGFKCSLTRDIAVLSNGQITFCCLDYEGELSCGNIRDMSLAEAAISKRCIDARTNPDKFRICRLCKGEIKLPL